MKNICSKIGIYKRKKQKKNHKNKHETTNVFVGIYTLNSHQLEII